MRRPIKRMIDLAAALVLLVTGAPVLAASALAVWATMGRPVLFRQPRAGYLGRPFTLIKFRTMRDALGADGEPLPDEQRLTPVGRFLRRTSLDELPQLWNILTGDMSLVGPRPLLLRYLPRYTPEQARRHEATPGITGWAQVNGRNDLPWEEKFRLDLWYVDHQSLRLDARILVLTALRVLQHRGVSRAGHATAPEFFPAGWETQGGLGS